MPKRPLKPAQIAPVVEELPREPSMCEPEKYTCFTNYLMGMEGEEISRITGIPANRIRNWIWREDWKKHRANAEKIIGDKFKATEQPVVKTAIANKKIFVENLSKVAASDSEHWKDMDPQERLVVASDIAALGNMHIKHLGIGKDDDQGEKGHISLNFLVNAHEPNMVKLIEPEKVKELPVDSQ